MNARSFVRTGALLLAALGCHDDVQSPTEPGSASPQAAPERAVSSNTWITRADMPSTTRFDPAVATVPNGLGQSVLYVIGGGTPSGAPLGRVQAYNAATNTWSWKASITQIKSTNGAGVINGKIYIPGGEYFKYFYAGDMKVYDPATNVWSWKQPMPAGGFDGLTGVIDRKLYVVTSCWEQSEERCDYLNGHLSPPMYLFRYDPLTDTWTNLATPPTPPPTSGIAGGGTIGMKLYVAYAGSKTLHVYDPSTNTWAQRTTTLEVRASPAMVTLGAKLYMIGGARRNPDSTWSGVRTTNVYDPATNLWSTRAPMPSLRLGMVAGRVVVNGQARIELVGGPRPGNNLQYIP